MATTNIDTTHFKTSTASTKIIENVISIEETTTEVFLQNWNKNDILLIQDSFAVIKPIGGEKYTDYLQDDFVVTVRQHGAVPPAVFAVGVYDPIADETHVYSLDVDLTISMHKGNVMVTGNLQP